MAIQIELDGTLGPNLEASLTAAVGRLTAVMDTLKAKAAQVGPALQTNLAAPLTAASTVMDTLSARTQALTTSLTTLTAALRNLNTSARTATANLTSISAALGRVTATAAPVSAATASINASMAQLATQSGAVTAQLATMSATLTTIANSLRQAAASAQVLSNASDKAEKRSLSFRRSLQDLTYASGVLHLDLLQTVSALGMVGNTLLQMPPWAQAAVVAFAGVQLAVKAIELAIGTLINITKVGLKETTTTFADYSNAIRAAAQAADGSVATFELFFVQAQRVALDFKFTSNEMALGLKTLSQAGLSMAESLAVLPEVAQLAAAGFAGLDDSADLLTTTIRAFGLAAQDASRISNVLVAAVNGSKTSIEGLRVSFNYVATSAAQFGLSIEETAAALGVLADAGVKASTQGTGLRGFMISLAQPTEKMQRALAEVGLTMDDVNVSALGMGQVLMNLNNAINPVTGAFVDADWAARTFTRNTSSVALVLISNAQKFIDLTNKITGTTAAVDGAKAAMNELSGIMIQAKNIIENFGLSIGQKVEPSLRTLLKTFLQTGDAANSALAVISAVTSVMIDLANQALVSATNSGALRVVMDSLIVTLDGMLPILRALAQAFLGVGIAVLSVVKETQIWAAMIPGFTQAVNGSIVGLTGLLGAVNALNVPVGTLTAKYKEQLALYDTYTSTVSKAREALKGLSVTQDEAVATVGVAISAYKALQVDLEAADEAARIATKGSQEWNEAMRDSAKITAQGKTAYVALRDALLDAGVSMEVLDAIQLDSNDTMAITIEKLRGLSAALLEIKSNAEIPVEAKLETDELEKDIEKLNAFFEQADGSIFVTARIRLDEPEEIRRLKAQLVRLEEEYRKEILAVDVDMRVSVKADFQAARKEIQDEIRKIEQSERIDVKVEADTLVAKSAIDALLTSVREGKAVIELTADDTHLLKKVREFLEQIKDQKGTLVIDADTAQALDKAKALVEEVNRLSAQVTIGISTLPAKQDIDKLYKDIKNKKIEVDVTTAKAVEKLREFLKRVSDAKGPTIVVDADIKDALATVAGLRKTIAEEEATLIKVDADTSAAEDKVRKLSDWLDELENKFDSLEDDGTDLGSGVYTLEQILESGEQAPYQTSPTNRYVRRQLPEGGYGYIPVEAEMPGFFAAGGLVPGTGNRDTVPALLSPGSFVMRQAVTPAFINAMLTPGEFVLPPDLVAAIGVDRLTHFNNGGYPTGFAQGGSVGAGGTVYNSSTHVHVSGRLANQSEVNAIMAQMADVQRRKGIV